MSKRTKEERKQLDEIFDLVHATFEKCQSPTDGAANRRNAQPLDQIIETWDLEKGLYPTLGIVRASSFMKVLLPHWEELLQKAYKKWPDKSLWVGLI